MIEYIIWGVLLVAGYRFLTQTDPVPIHGVYRQAGKWFYVKKLAFFILYKLRQRQNKKGNVTGENAGYGVRSRNNVEEMDKAQTLSPDHPMAVDAVYFNGGNKDGWYLVAATARRQNNLVQTLLYIRVPDVGLYELASLPDTALTATKHGEFAAGGLHISPVIAMKSWKLSFDGKMRLLSNDGKGEEVHVKFDIDWTADSPLFDFDTDMNTSALCEAMAREEWSRQFFNNLRDAHQTHYEQFGTMTGTIDFQQYGKREISVRGVRDHSYGNFRDWADLHRYGMQYLALEDKTAMLIGHICFPKTMSRLILGYVMHPDGTMDSVSSTDFELWRLGQDGKDPTQFAFNFTAGNKTYRLEGEVLDRPVFYMGLEWEARIVERMCKYKVNGVPGWGISEWDYRNYTGRPDLYKNRKH